MGADLARRRHCIPWGAWCDNPPTMHGYRHPMGGGHDPRDVPEGLAWCPEHAPPDALEGLPPWSEQDDRIQRALDHDRRARARRNQATLWP